MSNASISRACDETMEIFDLRSTPVDFIEEEYLYHGVEKRLITIFTPAMATLGLIGNIAFLVVVAKVKYMRTYTNAFLANLAICDITFILMTLYNKLGLFLLNPYFTSDPYDSNVGCCVVMGLLHLVHYTSIWLVIVMTFERYLGICKPLKHRQIVTKARIRHQIILAWAFGIVFMCLVSPRFGKLTKYCILWPDDEKFQPEIPTTMSICGTFSHLYAVVASIIQTIPYTMATVINVYLFGAIIMKLHSRVDDSINSDDVKIGQIGEKSAKFVRNHVARLLIITGSVFFLCYMPYYILTLNESLLIYFRIGFMPRNRKVYILVARELLTINAVINPFIYSVSSARYRKAFIAILGCSIIRNENSSLSTST